MKKKLLGVFLILTLIVSMTACGSKGDKPTPKELVTSMTEAIQEVDQFSMDFLMELKAAMKMTGLSMDLDFSFDGEARGKLEPLGVYAKFNMKGNVFTESLEESMEMYAVQDGEEFKSYIFDGTSWTQEVSENGLDELLEMFNQLSTETSEEDKEKVEELYSKMQVKEKGNEYTLSGNLKDILELSDDFADSIGNEFTDSVDAEMLDSVLALLEKVKVEYSMHIDKKTKLLTKFTFDIATDGNLSLDGFGLEALGLEGVEFDIEKANISMNLKYDGVEDIVVPEDVKLNAQSPV